MKTFKTGSNEFPDSISLGGRDKARYREYFTPIESLKTSIFVYFGNFIFNIFNYFKNRTCFEKVFAFTLAETLIVMGVIGVVAAITIPNMSRDTNNVEKVAKFKKLYNEISNAHEQAVVAYGPIEEWFKSSDNKWTMSQKYISRLTEFIKATKICTSDEAVDVDCMTSRMKMQLRGVESSSVDIRSAILASGASIGLQITSYACNDLYYDSLGLYTVEDNKPISCGSIYLDIDGPKKGKNTWGIDLFSFGVTKEGIKPAKFSSKFLTKEFTGRCTYGNTGGGACGQWILDNDNMDYLMAKDRSTADKSRTCPNGKKLGYNANLGEVRSCK